MMGTMGEMGKGKEEEIRDLFIDGVSPATIIKQGYSKSTVYKVKAGLMKAPNQKIRVTVTLDVDVPEIVIQRLMRHFKTEG